MSETKSDHIDLSKNEFHFSHHHKACAATKSDSAALATYPSNKTLKDKLAQDRGVSPEDLLLYAGGATAIKLVLLSYCAASPENKRTVLLPELTWQYYEDLCDLYDLKVETYDCQERDTEISLCSDDIKHKAVDNAGALIIIPSPNNPTGSAMTAAELVDVCNFVPSENTIFIDNCYLGFGSDDLPVGNLLKDFPNLIILNSFSKFYGLAGVRLAYLLAGGLARTRLMLQPQYLGYSSISERIAVACLNERPHYEEKANDLAKQRDQFQRILNGFKELKCYDSKANFLLLKIPGMSDAYVAHLKEKGVLVRRFESSKFPDCVRITVGTPQQMALVDKITREFLEVHGISELGPKSTFGTQESKDYEKAV